LEAPRGPDSCLVVREGLVSAVESAMRRLASLILFSGLIAQAGCSQSSPAPEPIKDMTPGEYRDKAEMDRQIPATPPKTGGKKPR
jgi:hypothetical protein